MVGTTVNFRYEVTNTGTTAISNVKLTDDRLADVTYLEGDINNDGELDPTEKWIYTGSEIAQEGLQTNKGTATATLDGTTLMAMDPANYTGIETPPPAGDVCDLFGDPLALTFEYAPGTDVVTGQASDKARILINNGVDDDGVSFIVVTDENDPNKALNGDGKQFFRNNVGFGEFFQADTTTDSFGSNTYIHFYDDAGGGLLQSIQYHTSCSQPIQIGDVIGNATLAEYFGKDGAFDNPAIMPIQSAF
jgi:hypothetical protein